MAERTIPNIPGYHGEDRELKAIFDSLRNAISALNNNDFVTEKDIYCRDLVTSAKSIYIGGFKSPGNKLENIKKQLYWNKTLIIDDSAGIAVHASRHSDGEIDEISHDDLADFVANEHIDWTSTSENIVTTGTIYGKGYRINIVAKTTAYTATAADDVITCGAGDETFTIDLPTPLVGKTYYIKNVGTGVITVDADTTGSTTIDGDTTQTVNQYECLKVVSDASVYWSI